MKIGILTFHRGLNHGGFLQAYATQTYLESLGHEVVVINYKNPVHWKRQDVLPWILPQKPGTWMRHFRKWIGFQRDFKKLHLTDFTTKSQEIEKYNLDLVVVGSDIVWNMELFGADLTYFGGFNVPNKIAYAPSFGWMPEDTELPKEILDSLSSFNEIMVRDQRSKKILENNMNRRFEIVSDPTILLPQFGDNSEKCDYDIMVYAFGMDDEWRRAIVDFAKTNALSIISTGYPTGLPGRLDLNSGPFKWRDMMLNSRYIITNTFHGTIYASLSGSPFVCINQGPSSLRISSYLDEIKCLERLIMSPDKLSEVLVSPPLNNIKENIVRFSDESKKCFRRAINNIVVNL